MTYHHNWFDGTNQRHPRVRFGNPVHVYNNYYSNNGGYGVASTEGAGVLVEGNYFENTEDPYHLGEGDSGPGTLVARNNHFVNSGAGQAGGSVGEHPVLLHARHRQQREVHRHRRRRRRPDLSLRGLATGSWVGSPRPGSALPAPILLDCQCLAVGSSGARVSKSPVPPGSLPRSGKTVGRV